MTPHIHTPHTTRTTHTTNVTQFMVRYMDFGNVEERESGHLMSLKSDFRLLPFQVCHCVKKEGRKEERRGGRGGRRREEKGGEGEGA